MHDFVYMLNIQHRMSARHHGDLTTPVEGPIQTQIVYTLVNNQSFLSTRIC